MINDSGAATIGQWARDVTMNLHVVAVRQNLALIVDHSRPVPGLDANIGKRWGGYENQHQYTWRSGVGVDAAGDLIYVAGGNLTLQTLAASLADAGVVRGMELDIHSALVSFASWAPTLPGRARPTKLLPGWNGRPTATWPPTSATSSTSPCDEPDSKGPQDPVVGSLGRRFAGPGRVGTGVVSSHPADPRSTADPHQWNRRVRRAPALAMTSLRGWPTWVS